MPTSPLTAAPGVGGSYAYNPDTGQMELIDFTADPAQARPPGLDAVTKPTDPIAPSAPPATPAKAEKVNADSAKPKE